MKYRINIGMALCMEFIHQLQEDNEFNLDGEFTQAYLEEVGYELRWDIERTRLVIYTLHSMGLIEGIK